MPRIRGRGCGFARSARVRPNRAIERHGTMGLLRSMIVGGIGLSLLLGACDSTDPREAAKPFVPVLAAWQTSQLAPNDFDVFGSASLGNSCLRGRTGPGLETTLCSYTDDAAATAARTAALELVGESTGLALVAGQQLLVLVDRAGADPTGKALDAVAQAFRKNAPVSSPKQAQSPAAEPAATASASGSGTNPPRL